MRELISRRIFILTNYVLYGKLYARNFNRIFDIVDTLWSANNYGIVHQLEFLICQQSDSKMHIYMPLKVKLTEIRPQQRIRRQYALLAYAGELPYVIHWGIRGSHVVYPQPVNVCPSVACVRWKGMIYGFLWNKISWFAGCQIRLLKQLYVFVRK